MRYLNNDDLKDDSFQRFITESTQDDPNVIDRLEVKAIDFAETYLSGRYDTARIFGTPVIRHALLADILTKILLYKIFSRNAARKVSEDIKADHDWAVKQLEKISLGSLPLNGLPLLTDDNGNPASPILTGNNSNPDYYI